MYQKQNQMWKRKFSSFHDISLLPSTLVSMNLLYFTYCIIQDLLLEVNMATKEVARTTNVSTQNQSITFTPVVVVAQV